MRGASKWYVDFDRCIPYFADTKGCAICVVVCPWSRPGVADRLLVELAKRPGVADRLLVELAKRRERRAGKS